jgi:phosphatidylserine/phosphatidylglycerophosphate/cardiolipin synthase-like enzyme
VIDTQGVKVSRKNVILDRILSKLRPVNIISALFLLFFGALFIIFYLETRPASPETKTGIEHEVGAVEVYFSAPDDPNARTLRGGPDAALAASIAGAQRSVDIAAYNLDLWSIRDALIKAQSSGAIVRVVVESANQDQPEIQGLLNAGIAVVPDTSDALMHHKFVVVDQWDVWTGSMNFTINGAYRHDNNLVHLQSNKLAQNYRREFEEMFVEGRFGRLSRKDTPFPLLQLGDASVQVYFSPDDDALSGLLEVLGQAEQQVLVLAFTLTADEITELLIEQKLNGIDVQVVMDADQIRSTGNDYARLLDSGVDVRTDRNPYNMHHKVMIIDEEVVITGSYNFTRSAEERNDENIIILKDEDLAQSYLVEFSRIWDAAQP